MVRRLREAKTGYTVEVWDGLKVVVVNPFENGLPDEAHWMEHMRADIGLLVGCDYIYMLRGWEWSKGAKLELDVATSCGIRVMEYKG